MNKIKASIEIEFETEESTFAKVAEEILSRIKPTQHNKFKLYIRNIGIEKNI